MANLEEHVKIGHMNLPDLSCRACHWKSSELPALVNHVLKEHTKVCLKCKTVLPSQNELEKHRKQKHELFKCALCEFTTDLASTLVSHVEACRSLHGKPGGSQGSGQNGIQINENIYESPSPTEYPSAGSQGSVGHEKSGGSQGSQDAPEIVTQDASGNVPQDSSGTLSTVEISGQISKCEKNPPRSGGSSDALGVVLRSSGGPSRPNLAPI